MSIEALPLPPIETRPATIHIRDEPNSNRFVLGTENRSYKHQYANIYYHRLSKLRQFVEEAAKERWQTLPSNPVLIPSVLEVVKSQTCYIIGTIYMDMPLKPNVMDDIAKDQSLALPPLQTNFWSPNDNVMLEDESGRIRLVGAALQRKLLITGVIIGALGMETPNGEFEVVDICYAGIPPKISPLDELSPPHAMEIDGPSTASTSASGHSEWIAVVSGLDVGAPETPDALIQLLVEYLTGEAGGVEDQAAASRISRLIIAGNSLGPQILAGNPDETDADDKKPKRYGQENSIFTPHPTNLLSAHLFDIGSVMPIHILPGDTDPAGTILPQQPFPRAMCGPVSSLTTFSCETNPAYLSLSAGITTDDEFQPQITRNVLVNSGQPLNDMFKYLEPSNVRVNVLESTLRWRHMAPTAPDTLWCHPYLNSDPFVLEETPDLYITGGQDRFATKMVMEGETKMCRLVLVPSFSKTGCLVLVNIRTLAVKTVTFGIVGMMGGAKEEPDAMPVEAATTAVKEETS